MTIRSITEREVFETLVKLGIATGKIVRTNEVSGQMTVVLFSFSPHRGNHLKRGWQEAVQQTTEALQGAGIQARASTSNAVIIDGWKMTPTN